MLLIGWVVGNPELRYTANGRLVASFTLSTTRQWATAEGERVDATEWFNVVAWGNLAEQSRDYLADSQQLYVEGRLQTRGWEDKEGIVHYRTEVVAHDLVALGLRPESK